ncbi:MAG: PD-(D/E)XK nuclease family protein, partial [Candidatus Omnitrophica bacterium]|nr:PD-(D/E)XK nuclease family protein [Candidatus Omnitrophota bacterium]
RSTQTVLDRAYQLIKKNDPDTLEVKLKISKELTSTKESGPSIKHLHFDTGATEANEVARLIEEKVKNEGLSFGEIAILVRSNSNAEPFLRALNMRSIPWRFSGSQGLYRQEEIRFLISFLRTLANPDDSISLYHLVSFPQVYNLDMTDLARCSNWASRKSQSLFTVFSQLDKIEELADIPPETKVLIGKIVQDLNYYLEEARTLSTERPLYLFLQQLGFIKELLKEEDVVNKRRIKNITRFFNIVENFENLAVEDRLPNFVRHLDMLISAGDDPAIDEEGLDLEAVNVLTVHKAKGLEFSVVFMVNLVKNRFPWPRRRQPLEVPLELVKDSLPSADSHIPEERRLFYVAMTRAKQELYFTAALDYGGKRVWKVSPFVPEALGESFQEPEVIRREAIQEIERFAPRAPTPALKEKPIASDKLLVLSFSQIDDYHTCPLKYYYKHVLHIPISRRHHSAIYGIAIHKAISDFYQAKIKKTSFTLENLFGSFQTAWVNEGFLSREHEEQRFAQGKETLKRFYEREKDKPLPVYIEEEFSFVLGKNNKVIVRWDRIDETSDGAVIIDFKTTDMVKELPQATKRVKGSLQLSIYALAYSIKRGELPLRVELHFVDTDLIGQAQRTEKDLEKTKELITQVSIGIRAQEFQAQPGYLTCEYCDYRDICPSTEVPDAFWSSTSSSPMINKLPVILRLRSGQASHRLQVKEGKSSSPIEKRKGSFDFDVELTPLEMLGKPSIEDNIIKSSINMWEELKEYLDNPKENPRDGIGLGYLYTIIKEAPKTFNDMERYASSAKDRGITTVIYSGEGGQILGNRALIKALGSKNDINFIFANNLESRTALKQSLKGKAKEVLFIASSKSGGTDETAFNTQTIIRYFIREFSNDEAVADSLIAKLQGRDITKKEHELLLTEKEEGVLEEV